MSEKKYSHFTKCDRLEISILLKKGYSQRDIADVLGKNHSSISREIKRGKVKGIYDANKAQHKAIGKRSNSKYQSMKIRQHFDLEDYIRKKMKNDHWTPEEIAGRWNREKHYDEKGKLIIISAPTIYKYLYGRFGSSCCQYLPSQRYRRKKRKPKKKPQEMIKNRIWIDNRPEIINQRERFGDFEADTLGSLKTDASKVAGLVERMSRYVLITKVSRLKYTMAGFKKLLNPHQKIVQSVTFDNGVENVRHQELQTATYFCQPYSSWQKASIENCFQRLRRFIPKKKSLKDFSQQDILDFAEIMNNTPRKCLDFRTPKEVFEEQSRLLNCPD